MKIICKLSRAEQRCQRSRPKTFYSFYRLSFFFLSRFVYVLFFPHSALANQTTVHSDINRSHSTDIGNENKNRIENNDDGDGKRLYDEMKTWIEYKMRKCRIETDALSISPSSFIVFFFSFVLTMSTSLVRVYFIGCLLRQPSMTFRSIATSLLVCWIFECMQSVISSKLLNNQWLANILSRIFHSCWRNICFCSKKKVTSCEWNNRCDIFVRIQSKYTRISQFCAR